jgi:ABC-type transporter Mla MlaB component
MPARISFLPDDDRLDIVFEGNLDVSVWQAVCEASSCVPPNLRACIVDLTAVERVFDSGIAVLILLCRRMRDLGASVVFTCDDADT